MSCEEPVPESDVDVDVYVCVPFQPCHSTADVHESHQDTGSSATSSNESCDIGDQEVGGRSARGCAPHEAVPSGCDQPLSILSRQTSPVFVSLEGIQPCLSLRLLSLAPEQKVRQSSPAFRSRQRVFRPVCSSVRMSTDDKTAVPAPERSFFEQVASCRTLRSAAVRHAAQCRLQYLRPLCAAHCLVLLFRSDRRHT